MGFVITPQVMDNLRIFLYRSLIRRNYFLFLNILIFTADMLVFCIGMTIIIYYIILELLYLQDTGAVVNTFPYILIYYYYFPLRRCLFFQTSILKDNPLIASKHNFLDVESFCSNTIKHLPHRNGSFIFILLVDHTPQLDLSRIGLCITSIFVTIPNSRRKSQFHPKVSLDTYL